MDRKINPFQELYFTESIDSHQFVKVFSDVLVEPALQLFKPGNIILKGLPGSGKTMMLNLLKPSIRLAYHNLGEPFPVPEGFNKFVGAGINLIRSSVSDFGQRPIDENKEDDLTELGIYFGDFLNYWIVRDILDSVQELGTGLGNEIGIVLEQKLLEKFVKTLKEDDCWLGYLDDVTNFSNLKQRFKERTGTYRAYLNYNTDEIPDEVKKTKTSIGVPIINTVQKLREIGVIKDHVQVLIRIDQYEELTWLDEYIPTMGTVFQSVIHKLLAMRDSTVSFKIGSRPGDWKKGTKQIFGTSGILEASRNYKVVSIEEGLHQTESQRGYIFPKFAEDIFHKRLQWTNPTIKPSKSGLLKEILGEDYTAQEKVKIIVKTSRNRIIKPDSDWPKEWTNFLYELAERDPLSAKLGEAWALQKGKSTIMQNIPKTPPYPWEKKRYWVKERTNQAVTQIASRASQQIVWCGKKDILNLSYGNILSFLSLCQHIWEVWMRDKKYDSKKSMTIDPAIQTLGILEASGQWLQQISNSSKNGHEVTLFINFLGGLFYKQLTDDVKMSYPGENGFSVEMDEIKLNPRIEDFLLSATDYGFLIERLHTPKTKGKKRLKWYINPILSPYFKIPAIHTKEPMYINIKTLDEWLVKSKVFDKSSLTSSNKKRNVSKNSGQSSLF